MYITYERYKEMGGELQASAFTRIEIKSEILVDYWTSNRIKVLETPPKELELLMYEMVEALAEEGRNVASFSNDGVSVTFDEKPIEEQLYDLAVAYLPAELISVSVEDVEASYYSEDVLAIIRELIQEARQAIQESEAAVQDLQGRVERGEFDGTSPTVETAQTETGATITITDRTGPHTAEVANGADGRTPVKGEDYYTPAEREEFKEDVLAETYTRGYIDGHFASAIKPTVTGNPLVLTDTDSRPALDFSIDGTTTQSPIRHLTGSVLTADKVTGGQTAPTRVESANLLETGVQDVAGITIAKDENGTLTLNGTCTEPFAIPLDKLTLKEGFYTLSANNPKTLPRKSTLTQIFSPSTQGRIDTYSFAVNDSRTAKLPSADDYLFRIHFSKGDVFSNYKISPKLEKGSVATPYTPYISDFSKSKVSVMGVNLFDISKIPNSPDVVNNGDGTISVSGVGGRSGSGLWRTAPKLKAGMKAFFKIITDGLPIIYLTATGTTLTNGESHVFTFEELDKGVYIYGNNEGTTATISAIQLSVDDVPVEPYKPPQTYTPQADGTVLGVQTIDGNMTVLTDKEGVDVDMIIPEPIVNADVGMVHDTGKNLLGGLALAKKMEKEFKATIDYEAKTVSYWASDTVTGRVAKKLLKLNPSKKYTVILEEPSESDGSNLCFLNSSEAQSIIMENGKGVTHSKIRAEYFAGQYATGKTVLYYEKCGIFEGELTEQDFEPFKGFIQSLSQRYSLSKWDRIFKDDEGWKVEKKSNTESFTGNETVDDFGSAFTIVTAVTAQRPNKVYCNISENVTMVGAGQSAIRFEASEFGTINEFKNILKNITVLYETETPTITPLPHEDAAILDRIATYYPNTVIQADGGVLTLKYAADTLNYIDSRYAKATAHTDAQVAQQRARTDAQVGEVRNAIISTGGNV